MSLQCPKCKEPTNLKLSINQYGRPINSCVVCRTSAHSEISKAITGSKDGYTVMNSGYYNYLQIKLTR